jgi:hypothetical protein
MAEYPLQPIDPQLSQQGVRQGNDAILRAFALLHPQPCTVAASYEAWG